MTHVRGFRADLYLLTTDDGGRRGCIRSGYRPPIDFGVKTENGERMYNDCEIILEDRERMYPGETARVTIRPYHPALLWGVLRVGLPFEIADGPNWRAGRGTSVELVIGADP